MTCRWSRPAPARVACRRPGGGAQLRRQCGVLAALAPVPPSRSAVTRSTIIVYGRVGDYRVGLAGTASRCIIIFYPGSVSSACIRRRACRSVQRWRRRVPQLSMPPRRQRRQRRFAGSPRIALAWRWPTEGALSIPCPDPSGGVDIAGQRGGLCRGSAAADGGGIRLRPGRRQEPIITAANNDQWAVGLRHNRATGETRPPGRAADRVPAAARYAAPEIRYNGSAGGSAVSGCREEVKPPPRGKRGTGFLISTGRLQLVRSGFRPRSMQNSTFNPSAR